LTTNGCRGIDAMWNNNEETMKKTKVMKSYEGLLESAFMFFMQLVVLCTRTPLGDSGNAGILLSYLNIGDCNIYGLNLNIFILQSGG
jgi:hypothetical protein